MVRGNGPEWVDDNGAFYPYGGTLMWALRGFVHERERVQANQAYLAKWGCNFQRNLVHVDWPGNEIDWRWAATEDVLGRFLDESWGLFRLRTSLTLLGSVESIDSPTRSASVITADTSTLSAGDHMRCSRLGVQTKRAYSVLRSV